jgi:hypothetical protein
MAEPAYERTAEKPLRNSLSAISPAADRFGPSEDWPGLDSLRRRRRWCQVANCSTGVRTAGESMASSLAASQIFEAC